MEWFLVELKDTYRSSTSKVYISVEAESKVQAKQTGLEKMRERYEKNKTPGKLVAIAVEKHHPEDTTITEDVVDLIDEREFSANEMYEFARETAMAFMAAAFEGKKNVDGKDLDTYISDALDNMDGSGI
jgi:hypothetical protein